MHNLNIFRHNHSNCIRWTVQNMKPSIPNSHPSWARIVSSGSCFKIPLACIPPHEKFRIIIIIIIQCGIGHWNQGLQTHGWLHVYTHTGWKYIGKYLTKHNIYSLLIEKDICDCRNISIKLQYVYLCFCFVDIFIFSEWFSSSYSCFCSN